MSASYQGTFQQGGSAVTSTSTKNNRGIVINAGSTTGIVGKRALGADTSNARNPSPADNSMADEAVSAGTFAYNNTRPIAMRTTSTLSGVANTALLSGADVPDQVRGINKMETVRTYRLTTALRAGYFNITTNKFTTPVTNAADNWYPGNTSTQPDTAASPTRSVPGRLTYKTGALVPVNDTYAPKYG